MLPLRLLEQLSVEHSPVQFFSGNSGSVEDDDVLWLKTGIRSIMKSLSNCCISLFL